MSLFFIYTGLHKNSRRHNSWVMGYHSHPTQRVGTWAQRKPDSLVAKVVRGRFSVDDIDGFVE